MMYEEKKEIKKQISQMLADAGLNQGNIKQMVEETIQTKVDKAVEQTLAHLNAQCESGDYLQERVKHYLRDTYVNSYAFTDAIKRELTNRIISVTLKDVVLTTNKGEDKNDSG